jgi:hypothetical protein
MIISYRPTRSSQGKCLDFQNRQGSLQETLSWTHISGETKPGIGIMYDELEKLVQATLCTWLRIGITLTTSLLSRTFRVETTWSCNVFLSRLCWNDVLFCPPTPKALREKVHAFIGLVPERRRSQHANRS